MAHDALGEQEFEVVGGDFGEAVAGEDQQELEEAQAQDQGDVAADAVDVEDVLADAGDVSAVYGRCVAAEDVDQAVARKEAEAADEDHEHGPVCDLVEAHVGADRIVDQDDGQVGEDDQVECCEAL